MRFVEREDTHTLELLHAVLVDGVGHVDDLEASFLDALDEGRVRDGLLGLAGDVVDDILALLHAADVVLERRRLFARGASVVSQELGQLLAVGRIFVDTQLDVLSELLVELLEVLLVFSDLVEQLDALLHQVLPDDLENLRLLQHFSGNVQWQVFAVDDTLKSNIQYLINEQDKNDVYLDEVEILGHQLFAVLHDENASDVQLDGVLRLLVLEKIEGSALRDEKKGAKTTLLIFS